MSMAEKLIEDFGEKIGGARKDLYALNRELRYGDIIDWNSMEREKFITKKEAFPLPNYEKMLKEGKDREVLFFIKKVRDALPTKPMAAVPYLVSEEQKKTIIEAAQKNYLVTVNRFYEKAMELTSISECIKFYDEIKGENLPDENCFNRKLIRATDLGGSFGMYQFRKELENKQFLFSDEEKILSQFSFFRYDGQNVKKEEYEKARRILKKAAKIDKTNSTTLRFLREVDEQTGTITSLEPRRWAFGLREKEEKVSGNQSIAYRTENDVVIQPPTFRESSMAATLLNLGFGFLVGACLVWFLMVPANTQRINKAANEKVVSYSNTMATQSAEMNKLQEQIDQSEETVASAQQQIEDAQNQTSSYENLIKAYAAFQSGNYTSAANVLQNVQADLLSVDAKEIYDSIYKSIQSTMKNNLKSQGEQAFYAKDYETAITDLNQALEMDDSDYEVLNLLAHSYRLDEQYDKAVEIFQKIVDQFPGTKRASTAQKYIDNGGKGFDSVGQKNSSGTGTAQTQDQTGNQETVSQDTAEQSSAGDTADTQNTGGTGANQNGNGGEAEGTSGENGQ